MTGQARVRIGRITPKLGNLALFATGCSEKRLEINDTIRRTLDSHEEDIAGFAIVAWSVDGGWTAVSANYDGSPITSMDVPRFVERRLEHRISEDFTVDRMRGMLGWD